MIGKTRTDKVKEGASSASELALRLSRDRQFRKSLLSALKHGSEAGRRVREGVGLVATVRHLAADAALRRELMAARDDLERARTRMEAKRRSRRLWLLGLLAGLGSLAAVPQVRAHLSSLAAKAPTSRDDLAGLKDRLPAVPGAPSGRTHSLDDLTKEELYARAQEADVPGRSEMSKEELIAALRARR